jgi:hypothetical protein
VVVLMPPAPVPVTRASFFANQFITDQFITECNPTQWCWGNSCIHNEWSCVPGACAKPINACCVVCCWSWDPDNCSEARCCPPR